MTTEISDDATWQALIEEGTKAFENNQYAKAETQFKDALTLAEKLFEADGGRDEEAKIRLTKSLNNLGALYHVQGKYSMAEALYERCLDLKLELYGQQHLEVAVNLHNLAVLHSATRTFMKAEVLYKRALEIREQLLGEEHKDLVPVLRNYALLLRRNQRAPEAEPLEKRADKIAEATKES
ncbi:MAG: tetratricopeptide repeat protein [Cyanobacteria bacterium]|nr:tetratricopeptide repeat protein [Cyanobacteriota bacterium]